MNNSNKKINKHLLFYSNLCTYSNEIYQKILKYNLKENFYLIDISKNKFKIPDKITSVPSLLLNDKKTLLKEENLEEFINNLNKKNEIDVLPYFQNGSLLSDNYSLLNENDINDGQALNKGFDYINSDSKLLLIGEDKKSNKNINENKGLIDKMNSIQEDRNKDIQNIFNRKPPPVK